MFLGLSLSQLVTLHVVISFLAMASGVATLLAMMGGRRANGLVAFFLVTTALTSITGFMFSSQRIGVGHVTGALSLILLFPAIAARHRYRLMGAWRWIHVAGMAALLYLNVFIGIRQAFAKGPFLYELTSREVVYVVALLLCALAAILAARRVEPLKRQAWWITHRPLHSRSPSRRSARWPA
jgi:hypothetical protein